MKIIRFIFPCLLFSLVVTCTQRGGEEQKETGVDKRGSEAATDLSEPGETDSLTVEEFDHFLHKFSMQQSFQLNRIKFPIKAIVPDTDHEGMAPMEETIGRYEWEMIDLTYDSTFLTRPYDQYYQVVRFRNDTAVVEIRGINNGIYADYYFELFDKQWYLVSLYEASF